jgi:hypothetical protein
VSVLPSSTFRTVVERDIDLLLLEELRATKEFRTWWLTQLGVSYPESHEMIGAWHSYSTNVGESDVMFVTVDTAGRRHCVMIEDKIYAPPQPNQADRYRQRADDGVKKGLWQHYAFCITAAQHYLNNTGELDEYPLKVSHEDIRGWFQSLAPTARIQYKIDLLTVAIDQSKAGYVMVVHPDVTTFWREYWRIADREFAELRMKEPGNKGAKSRWIVFSAPKPGMRLIHKLNEGRVELELSGQFPFIADIRQINAPLIKPTVHLRPAGNSVVFQMKVDPIDHIGPAADQLNEIREGLRTAQVLFELAPLVRFPNDDKESAD